jgi:hypothetical protein
MVPYSAKIISHLGTVAMTIPQVAHHLPDLLPFIHELARDYTQGALGNEQQIAAHVHAFFTPAMLDNTDAVIPGWRTMAEQRNGVTLVHVMCVLTALLLCPEYQQATPEQQTLAQWIVLFHDVAKDVRSGKRDHTHGFRSTAIAGRALLQLGFGRTGNQNDIEKWATLTENAIIQHPDSGEMIQDNRRLPEIIAGIRQLFGRETPAALVVKAVLLHMSLDVVQDWPQTAPLTDDAIRQYLDVTLLPLLKIMILADNDAWALFDKATKQRYRTEVLDVFDRIQAL